MDEDDEILRQLKALNIRQEKDTIELAEKLHRERKTLIDRVETRKTRQPTKTRGQNPHKGRKKNSKGHIHDRTGQSLIADSINPQRVRLLTTGVKGNEGDYADVVKFTDNNWIAIRFDSGVTTTRAPRNLVIQP